MSSHAHARGRGQVGVPPGNRRCSVCRRVLPLDARHFPRNADAPAGLGYRCLPCYHAGLTARRRAKGVGPRLHRAIALQEGLAAGLRRCTGCLRVLPLAEFYRYRASPTGHDYRCPDCHRAVKLRRRAGGGGRKKC